MFNKMSLTRGIFRQDYLSYDKESGKWGYEMDWDSVVCTAICVVLGIVIIAGVLW